MYKAKKSIVFSGVFLILAAVLTCFSFQAESSEIKIGQIDMELVYNSYPGMQAFRSGMERLQREFQEAQEAGDQSRVMELQQNFQTKQNEFHMGFESDLVEATESVGRRHGVDLIVLETVYQGDNVVTVDLSDAIIEEMNGEAGSPESLIIPQQ